MLQLRPADDTPAAVDVPAVKANAFRLLTRHFFDRFFDKESISPQGEPEAGVIQTLGILAVPGAFFVLLFRPLTLFGWSLVSVRYMFVLYSMVVMGFIMVFEWDALFPDRRDYQILTPAPVRLGTLFLAKAAALGIFLAIFLVDINFFSFLFWPGVDGGRNVFDILRAHVIAVLAGGLFAALAVAALQGLLISVFPGRAYRRVSVALQTVLMSALVMLFFLIPMIGFSTEHLIEQKSPVLHWFPGFWFIGFYEQLRPAVHNGRLASLGNLATCGLLAAAAIFLLTYLPGYRRHARRAVETLEPGASGPGPFRRWLARALDRTVLQRPVEHAVFHFITQSITRSVKHRLFLATYGGFGGAVAVLSLGGGRAGLLTLPLSLSFVLVSGLRAAFNFPSELQANWTFQISEFSPVEEYLSATRKWIVVCAILPLFVLLSPMEFACFPPAAAAFHLAFGITLSILLMEIMLLGFRKAPFTCAHFPGKVNLVFLGVLYVFGFTLYSRTMASFEQWLGRSAAAQIAFFVAAGAILAALARWRNHRLAAAQALDYEDATDPIVRTLGLSLQ
jgi:hypothetical protein